MPIRILIGALMVAQLSACSMFGHKRQCTGDNCLASQTAKEKNLNSKPHQWYCYGQESGNWDCLNKPDKSRVVAITPKYQAPVNPDQVPGADSQPVPTEKVDIRPMVDITNSILEQPDDSYTVQLTASRNRSDLEDYAREHNVTQPVYIEVPGDNGTTYIMLLGVFSDQDKAIDAREVWERTRRLEDEPWVRKLGPLQKAIKAKEKDG